MEFGFTLGAWAFMSLVALLIIYLIRPRPKDVTIPSLMFIIKESGKSIKSSFLEKLLKNLIFLLQAIALAALALAIMQPIINIAYDSASANTVIILDASASMAAHDSQRFDDAVDIAKSSMKGDVSIVLAQEFPVLLLDNKNKGEASSILSRIEPKDVGTNLGDAMLLAKDLLQGEEGRVIVLSDFAYTSGPDPNVVKKILEADGAVVDLVDIGEPGDNAGIIDLVITRYETDVFIKNYNDNDKELTISVVNRDNEIKKVSMSMDPHSITSFSFETPSGETEVRINEKDDLMPDNSAYITAPDMADINVLLITNDINKYLRNAMEASRDISLKIAEPPIIPDFGEFDVIILGSLDHGKLLTGTLDNLEDFVKRGRSVVVTAKPDSHETDYGNIIPVSISDRAEQISTKIYPYSQSSASLYGFVDDESIDFGTTNQYFIARAENNSVVYAMTADNNPVIVSSGRGEGSIVYYGILDRMATFKSSPSYPVFWNDLINSLAGTEDINSFNYPTGKLIALGAETQVRTPDESIRTDRILLDGAGFYTYNDKTISANLLSEAESDINRETTFDTTGKHEFQLQEVERRKDVNLEIYLIIIALIAMLLELFLVKYRGDL
ncbi:VWA domain-containing protein [Candidatus Woesearchaeota archaeon]|nr:VWA domain-containing protein [Candidatus Woesearchaeota archaeon]